MNSLEEFMIHKYSVTQPNPHNPSSLKAVKSAGVWHIDEHGEKTPD